MWGPGPYRPPFFNYGYHEEREEEMNYYDLSNDANFKVIRLDEKACSGHKVFAEASSVTELLKNGKRVNGDVNAYAESDSVICRVEEKFIAGNFSFKGRAIEEVKLGNNVNYYLKIAITGTKMFIYCRVATLPRIIAGTEFPPKIIYEGLEIAKEGGSENVKDLSGV